MLLNLSDVLTSEGKETTAVVPIETDAVEYRGESYPVLDKSPVQFTFTNIGVNKVRVKGTAELSLKMVCDRCLKDVPTKICLNIDRNVSGVSEENPMTDEDDAGVMKGYQLNVEKLVYNEILMNWPLKVLCKPDCKGICKICGKDLNLGDCGCDTFVPDPRMAAIQDIFNANKEV